MIIKNFLKKCIVCNAKCRSTGSRFENSSYYIAYENFYIKHVCYDDELYIDIFDKDGSEYCWNFNLICKVIFDSAPNEITIEKLKPGSNWKTVSVFKTSANDLEFDSLSEIIDFANRVLNNLIFK